MPASAFAIAFVAALGISDATGSKALAVDALLPSLGVDPALSAAAQTLVAAMPQRMAFGPEKSLVAAASVSLIDAGSTAIYLTGATVSGGITSLGAVPGTVTSDGSVFRFLRCQNPQTILGAAVSVTDTIIVQAMGATGSTWRVCTLPQGIDFGALTSALRPSTTSAYDLGSTTLRWRDAWLSGVLTAASITTTGNSGFGTASPTAPGHFANLSASVGQVRIQQLGGGGKTWELQSFTDGSLYVNNQAGQPVARFKDALGADFFGGVTATAGSNSPGFVARSGSTSSISYIDIGRTSTEGSVGISAASGNFHAGSVAGDMCITSVSGALRLGIGGGAPSVAVLTSAKLQMLGLLDLSASNAGQIKFPATQNASSDPNTLDDYEEGTWTPGVAFGGGSTGVTYGINSGKYVKTGRGVIASAYMTITNLGSSTGALTVTGLPFGMSDYGCSMIRARLNGTLLDGGWGYHTSAFTSVPVYSTNGTAATQANLTAGVELNVTFTYNS